MRSLTEAFVMKKGETEQETEETHRQKEEQADKKIKHTNQTTN